MTKNKQYVSARDKAILSFKEAMNSTHNINFSFDMCSYYLGSDMKIEEIQDWASEVKHGVPTAATPNDVLDLWNSM